MMPIESQAPVAGMPDFDPKADRGSDFTPDAAPVIELTAEDLKAIGRAPVEPAKEAAKEPAKAEDKKEPEAKTDKGDEVTPPKEEPKTEEKKDEAKPEAKAEEKKDDDRPRDKDGKFIPTIPKARFDEVNRKAREKIAALESKNKALETRLGIVEGKGPDTKPLEAELVTKTSEYTKLVADGELDAANAVMASINKLNRQLASIESSAYTSAHAAEVGNVAALDALVDMYKEAFPVFDSDAPEFNQDHVNYVADLQHRFETTGSSPAEALREAVELAVAKFHLDAPAAAAEKAAEPEGEKKADKAAERVESAVDKALKAAKQQPATLSNVGDASDSAGMGKISIEQISDMDTFKRLPESSLSRLRGDIV